MATVGRKPFIPTQQQRDLVSQLAAMGVPQAEMRLLILKPGDGKPVSVPTLERAFRAELDTGELKANAKVAGALFTAATKGNNITAMIFWLKTRARWREVTRLEHTGADGAPMQQQLVPPDLGALTADELVQFETLLLKVGGKP